jgi:hypothetical protein
MLERAGTCLVACSNTAALQHFIQDDKQDLKDMHIVIVPYDSLHVQAVC